ncbi:MAG TPA: protein kinase [Polyangiaceae bacterium]|nr:protein kinase [Polyangiaceae bacterium]
MWGAPSPTTSCLSENALASFVEGRVEGDARQAVEEHLADCSDCRAVLAKVAGVAPAPSASSDTPWIEDADDRGLGAGTRVGRYVIETFIGQGAMGTVYGAHDPDLDRKVAVKLLRAESLSDAARQRMRARLLREAKAMARLSHPEVITVYDVGTFGDQLFVAMEHVDGCTLRTWRAAQHRSYAEIMAVYERAGSGLAAAHEAGLVHRDFKPDNVLIGRDGRVRVMDFGLARSEDGGDGSPKPTAADDRLDDRREVTTLTRTGALLGTPAYMAPEQLRGHAASSRSDVFSFCVSLYEALYGERPFAGTTVVELQTAIERGKVRPAPIMTRVPGWVHAQLMQGLRASPEARFASMRAVLDALRSAHMAARRRKGAAAAAGAAALGLLVACVASYARVGPAASNREAARVSSSVASFSAPIRASRAEDPARAVPPATAAAAAEMFGSAGAVPETPSPHRTGSSPAGLSRSPPAQGTARPRAAPDSASSLAGAAQAAPVPATTSSSGANAASAFAAPRKPIVGNNGALILE